MLYKRNVLLIALIMLFTVVASATELQAHGIWVEGVVTKAPWKSDYLRLKVDRVVYIILPKCRVFRQVQSAEGAYGKEPATWDVIKEGDKVNVKAQGNRIFDILIEEGA